MNTFARSTTVASYYIQKFNKDCLCVSLKPWSEGSISDDSQQNVSDALCHKHSVFYWSRLLTSIN